MDVNLSTLWEIVKDRGTWHAAVHGVTEWDMTEQLNICFYTFVKNVKSLLEPKWRNGKWLGAPWGQKSRKGFIYRRCRSK